MPSTGRENADATGAFQFVFFRLFSSPMRFFTIAKGLFILSAILVVASVVTVLHPGPRLSIEFTGGTLMEFQLPDGKTKDDVMMSIRGYNADLINTALVATTKDGTVLLRTPTLTQEEHAAFVGALSKDLGTVQELQFTTIGPTVGAALKRRSVYALIAASVAIVLYLAFVFRSLPRTISSWTFGIGAVLGLLHDVLITSGVFTILSYTTSFQMDTLFVTALLSIMGYSVNDTIIIFDRIRDNLLSEGKRNNFADIAARSLHQTLGRTINTASSTLIVLFALYLLGADSIRWFSLTLIFGTLVGTYSSFFIATPFVVFWHERMSAKKK